METDSMQDRLIHESWTPPAENWMDYFTNIERLEEVLKDSVTKKELLGKLATQFAEHATSAEVEERSFQAKNSSIEDIKYYQSKSACLWLCSMACTAAIQWDIYYLLENFDFLTIRPIVEFIKKIYKSGEFIAEISFGDWIWNKFCHAVLMQNRVPIPVPKPTVNNPLLKSAPDLALQRYGANQQAILELQISTALYVQSLENLTKNPAPLVVPGWRCFYDPFKEGASKSLNVGISGENVLVTGVPKATLSSSIDTISSNEVVNRAKFELLEFYFDDDNMVQKCLTLVQQIVCLGNHPLTKVEKELIDSYKIAFEISKPILQQIPPEKEFDDDNSQRDLGVKRLRQEAEIGENKMLMVKVSNMACDVIQQQPVLIRQLLEEKMCRPFIQALNLRMKKISDEVDRRRIFALLHYFCATIPGFKQILVELGFPNEWLRDMVSLPAKAPFQSAQKHIIQALIVGNGANPYWTMLTSFNIAEIRRAVDALLQQGSFKVPARFRYSELLTEFVGNASRSVIEINAILVAKATQLASLQSFVEWEQYCNQLPPFFASEKLSINLLLYAMHVKNFSYNRKLHTSWDVIDMAPYNVQLTTAKKLFNNACLPYPILFREILAFLLNAKEFEFIVKLDTQHFLVNLARILAAFGTRGGNTDGINEVLKLWIDTTRPLFERPANNRRNELPLQREALKNRAEFIRFLRLIKEPGVSLFLINYFTHVFNIVIDPRRDKKLRLFVQQPVFFTSAAEPPRIGCANVEFLTECLTEVLKSGIECNPCNAFFLRTFADLKYLHGEMEEAAILYMETIIACSPSCQPPFPDNVIDNVLWTRLRVCVGRMDQFTISALICQLIKSPEREEEYSKAAAALANGTTTDAGPECFSMIYDHDLAEALSNVYDNAKQFNNMARLQLWIGKLSLNPSNRVEILIREQHRRVEHLLRFLASYLFGTQL